MPDAPEPTVPNVTIPSPTAPGATTAVASIPSPTAPGATTGAASIPSPTAPSWITTDVTVPAFLRVTGITDPVDSDPLIFALDGSANGFPRWTVGGGTDYIEYDGIWVIALAAGADYLATNDGEAGHPGGLTGWTVLQGAGSPVIEAYLAPAGATVAAASIPSPTAPGAIL